MGHDMCPICLEDVSKSGCYPFEDDGQPWCKTRNTYWNHTPDINSERIGELNYILTLAALGRAQKWQLREAILQRWEKSCKELDEWHAECDKVGIPYPAGLVRHHRGNAAVAAGFEAFSAVRDAERRAEKAETELAVLRGIISV